MAKIKYGLKNVHYAVVTETTDSATGVVTSSYGTIKAWPGAVNLTLDAQGDDSNFYADDGVYVTLSNNTGYSGTFESALVPEDVNISVMGQTKDVNGVIIEKSDDVKKYIALMFEFAMDSSGRRFLFYRCSLARPSVASTTKGESIDPQTESVTITATPRPDDNAVKAYTEQGSAAYNGWYSAVYNGSASPVPSINLSTHAVTITDEDTYMFVTNVVPRGTTVTWSSSNTSVASVDDGEVTGESAGTAIITASITVNGVTYTDTATVVVTE